MSLMRNGLLSFALVVVAIIAATSSASAHPHVWVTVHSEVSYGPNALLAAAVRKATPIAAMATIIKMVPL
jgi:ABC-type uncharacterized transport system substrate-binding protein